MKRVRRVRRICIARQQLILLTKLFGKLAGTQPCVRVGSLARGETKRQLINARRAVIVKGSYFIDTIFIDIIFLVFVK